MYMLHVMQVSPQEISAARRSKGRMPHAIASSQPARGYGTD